MMVRKHFNFGPTLNEFYISDIYHQYKMVLISEFLNAIIYRFDVESKGEIDVEEMKFVLKNLPVKVTEDEVEAIIRAVDEDGDGGINIEEFRRMIGLE